MKLHKNIVICCDSNAHNIRWGSIGNRCNRLKSYIRGDQLIDLIDECNLHICNITPHKPTFIGGRGLYSHIDLSLCTYNMMHNIVNWNVSIENFESDHNAIYFNIQFNFKTNNSNSLLYGVLWKKPSTNMMHVMNNCLPKFVSYQRRVNNQKDIDTFIQRHSSEVRTALERIFIKNNKNLHASCYWWTNEVSNLHKKMKKARRKFGRYKYENLRNEYNKCRCVF